MNQQLHHKVTGKTIIISPVEPLEGVHLYHWHFLVNGKSHPCFGDKRHAEITLHNEIQKYLKFGYEFV